MLHVESRPGTRDEWMTVEEVAELLRVTPAWVRAHANGNRKPKIPSAKVGKHRRFRRSTVCEFMRQLEQFPEITFPEITY